MAAWTLLAGMPMRALIEFQHDGRGVGQPGQHRLDQEERATQVDAEAAVEAGDTATAAAVARLGIVWQPTFVAGPRLRSGALLPLLPGYRACPTSTSSPSTRAVAT